MTGKKRIHCVFEDSMQWHRILIEKLDKALVERWLLLPVGRIFVCRNGGDLNVTTL